MYVVAGHKGHPQAVAAKGRKGRRNRLKGSRGRGTLAKEKPPILGLVQRNGEVIIKMLANVQQDSIKPIIQKVVAVGSKVFTDEYNIYNRLTEWGYEHQTVNHSQGEYARDEDGDGFHEVHTNTIEGVITSYSIHYTKLYEIGILSIGAIFDFPGKKTLTTQLVLHIIPVI